MRTIMDFDGAPWVDTSERVRKIGGKGNFAQKSLTAPDGATVRLVHYDGEAPPHFHVRPSTLYVFDGAVEVRGRQAGPGSWLLEPYGAIHPRTLFKNVTYGFGMAEGDMGAGIVVLESIDDIPQWMRDAGFGVDEWANLTDTATLEWQPFGAGRWIKVLHVFAGRPAFASLLRAQAGAELPRRTYAGPVDMYVLSGRADFGDAVARRGSWVHEPAGTEDGVVTFPVDTEILVNTYGTVLEFSPDGALARIIDGYSFKRGVPAVA